MTCAALNEMDNDIEFDLSMSKCTGDDKEKLRSLLKKHRKAFMGSNDKLGYNNSQPLKIEIKDDVEPLNCQPYRYAPHIKEALNKQIDYLLQQGVIIETDDIEFASPLLAVRKQIKAANKHLYKDKTKLPIRLLIDMRGVNKRIKRYQKFEIPSLGSLLDIVSEKKCKYFSKVDLSSGYFQAALHPDSYKYCGFLWSGRSFAFTRLVQGLVSSPAAFSRLINHILRRYTSRSCIIYLDDVLILSPSVDQHLRDIDDILTAFTNANMKISAEKSQFCVQEIEFIGHCLTH